MFVISQLKTRNRNKEYFSCQHCTTSITYMWCSGNFKGIVCFLIADTDKDYDNNSSSCNEQSALLTSEHLPMCQKSLDFGSQGTKTTLLFNTLDIEDADVARLWQILYKRANEPRQTKN